MTIIYLTDACVCMHDVLINGCVSLYATNTGICFSSARAQYINSNSKSAIRLQTVREYSMHAKIYYKFRLAEHLLWYRLFTICVDVCVCVWEASEKIKVLNNSNCQ